MDEITTVLIGDMDIRTQVREVLAGMPEIAIAGELSALEDRHLPYLAELKPAAIVLDGAATGLDPVATLARLGRLPSRPRVIAVLAGGALTPALAAALGTAAAVETDVELRSALQRERLRLVPTTDYHRAA